MNKVSSVEPSRISLQNFNPLSRNFNSASVILGGLILVAVTLGSGTAQAAGASGKEVKFRDTDIQIQDGDHLVITGLRGSVRLIQTGAQTQSTAALVAMNSGAASPVEKGEATATLRARKMLNEKGLAQWASKFDDLSIQTKREGHVVTIEAKGPKSAGDWLDWTQSNSPELSIDLSINSSRGTPVEVTLHDGTIDIRGWQANIAASLVHGNIRTEETLGDLQLQVQHGEMRIVNQHGAVDVDSFQGKLIADRVEGDIHLDNFSGDSSLKNISGNVFVRTHTGPTNVADSSGAIDFELGRGALNVAKFEGPVRGQTDTAPVMAKLEGESDVNIESAQGPVAVRLPASSGAAIRLQTETGSLNAPEEIRASQNSSSKFASGRMKGSGPKGSVTIKSKAASIRVRPEAGGASSRGAPESESPAPNHFAPDAPADD